MGNGWCPDCHAAGVYSKPQGGRTALTRKRDAAIAEAGVGAVLALVRAGLSMREIAGRIGLEATPENGARVSDWLRNNADGDFEEARRDSADALAEKAFDLYGDRAPVTSADAKWRNDRAGHVRWLAELRSGMRDKNGVTLNVQQLHLEALREANGNHRSNRDQSATEVAGQVPLEAEIIQEEA